MSKKLYVGNLTYDIDSSRLEQMFATYGAVTSAQVVTDKETRQSRGFGFVEMQSEQDARAAVTALNGKNMGGRNLVVNEAKPQEQGGRSGYGGGRQRSGRY